MIGKLILNNIIKYIIFFIIGQFRFIDLFVHTFLKCLHMFTFNIIKIDI